MSKFLQVTVSARELASRKLRSNALHELLADLPNTPHPSLVGKQFAPMVGAFETMTLSIHKFRYLQDHLEPIKIQRDHMRRIERNEVDYLYNLSLAHVSFVLVVPPGNVKRTKKTKWVKQGDGNTRSSLFFVGDRMDILPDMVSVMVYYPDSDDALQHLYHCIDSGANVKLTRHNVTSFYRSSEALSSPETLTSDLVRDGNYISTLRRLAWLHGMAPPEKKDALMVDKLEALVHLYQHELRWLDQFGLKTRGLKSQGFVTLALYLRKQLGASCQDELTNFVNEIIRMVKGNRAGVSPEVLSAFAQIGVLFPQGIGGETPVDAVFLIGYQAFFAYLGNKAVERKQAERKALLAAQKALPPVPDYFVHRLNAVRLKAA